MMNPRIPSISNIWVLCINKSSTMPSKSVMTPKEIAIAKANEIVHSYGYHTGNVVDYDVVVEILTDIILQQNQQ